MKTINLKRVWNFTIILAGIIGFIMVSVQCDKEIKDEAFTTSEGMLIGEFLQKNPDNYSELYKVLKKTNSVSFLKAYGVYTLFAPENEAFFNFYQLVGKTTVDDFTSEEDIDLLKKVVKYHICPDSIPTSRFVSGGLPDTTMSGFYLVTSFGDGGINTIYINEEALITQRDISLVNGIVHKIDKVLDPRIPSVAEVLLNDTAYSIFAEALVETGLYDSLDMERYKLTVFAETDSVFAKAGINSYDDLFKLYSQTGEPYLNSQDSLYLWVAYHCMKNIFFLPDLENNTYGNLAYGPLFTISKGTILYMNDVMINVTRSNQYSSNAALHSLDGVLTFVPVPVAIFWEITDQPELRALTDYFRVSSQPDNDLKKIPIESKNLPDGCAGIRIEPGAWWKYGNSSTYTYRDYFEFLFSQAENRLWFELVTPALVKNGVYDIWICGKNVQDNPRALVDIYWDDEWVATIDEYPQREYISSELDALHDAGELLDRKLYTQSQNKQFVGYKIMENKEILTEGTHTIKVIGKEDGYCTWDMIHFIPSDQDQFEPVFTKNGEPVGR